MENNYKTEMINSTAQENRAFLNLQQIDDPEFTFDERKKMLEEVLDRSHIQFLMRFGPYMKVEHVRFFENEKYDLAEDQYEIDFYVNFIKQNNSNKNVTVKNRRYEAMKKLTKEGSYFSEVEMMKRDPLLYHEFVGQYLTEAEVQMRDGVNNESSFVNVILETIDRNEAKELKLTQENQILSTQAVDAFEDDSNTCDSTADRYSSMPSSCRQLWGGFDDNLTEKHHNSKQKKELRHISREQRALLKSEFKSIMQSKFLSGCDEDFDYSTVDLNEEYDDLDILARDEEEKYFDSEEATNGVNTNPNDDQSDDELDLYMETLNKSMK